MELSHTKRRCWDVAFVHSIVHSKVQCIWACRELVTKTYNKANGYETDCEVIYGDTDSVMVHFKVPDVARAMELGREAAASVSKTFIKPIKLEFEKVR